MIEHNLKDQLRGDTYDGATFTITVNGAPKDLTGAEIKIDFKAKKKDGKLQRSFSSVGATPGITIVDAVNGVIRLNPFLVDFDAGLYYYDVQTKIGDVVKTYVYGTWTINQDTTD